jgi:hypothetical protein
MTTPSRIRCAIYTRKSSEEGLEQSFNSLDAQQSLRREQQWTEHSTHDVASSEYCVRRREMFGRLLSGRHERRNRLPIVAKSWRLIRRTTTVNNKSKGLPKLAGLLIYGEQPLLVYEVSSM